jgi:pyruvate dehydrogenase (quinone)/pyruvate oxidase
MAQTAAEVLIDTIRDWGVDVVFGLPGDGINGIMEALRRRQDSIRFIQVRHEESAAFMACAYAKYTGRLGVCLATSGPGGIHLLNGLYDAKLDGAPVLAITGMPFHDLIGTHMQQDVELDKLFMDVAVYNERVMGAAHVENVANLACRKALSERGVAHLTFPVDVQEQEGGERSKRNVARHASDTPARSLDTPTQGDLERAAGILNDGRKVVILAGQGALGSGRELEQLADALGAPIVKALLGKGVVPDASPFTTGGIGLLGTRPSEKALQECDTLLIVGSSFPYIEFLPKPGKARGVQIDINPDRIGLRYPVEVGLVGSSQQTLARLLPLITRKRERQFLEDAQAGMADWWKLMEEEGTRDESPMKPQVLAWELGKRLRDDAIVSCDSGTITTWFARHITAKQGQLYSLSGTLASMANGLPYTIAAQIAHPGRQCIGFVGDGGFSMLMAELATAVKYQLPVKIIVVRNDVLGMIKWEQMVFLGNPEFGVQLQPIDFVKFAEACGATGFRIERQQDCGAILDQALSIDGPVLVEGVVDPLEPPLPASITRDQAVKFAESLIRGEPDRAEIARTALANALRQLI